MLRPHASRRAVLAALLTLTLTAGDPARRPDRAVTGAGSDPRDGRAGAPTLAAATAGGPGPALTVVNLDTGPVDVYLDGVRVTPPGGLGAGRQAGADRRGEGPVTVEVIAHTDPAPDTVAGSSGRAGLARVTIPPGDAASLVVGQPGAPVQVFAAADVRPAWDRGRLILRHTVAGAIDIEVIALGDEHTFLARQRLDAGAQLDVDVPGGAAAVHVRAQAAGTTFAVPELLAATLSVEAGQVRTAYLAPQQVLRHPPVSCPAATVPPAGAEHVSEGQADADGDGDHERVAVWAADAGGASRWHLGVSGLGAGGVTAELALPASVDPGAEPAPPRLVGAADADGRGADELFVAVAQGGHTQGVQVWGLQGCRLAPTVLAGSPEPATLAVGASARSKSGVACAYPDLGGDPGAGAILGRWEATGGDRDTFTVTVTDHSWTGPLALRAGPVTVMTRPADDEWTLLQASGLRCGRPPYTLVSPADQQVTSGPAVPAAVPARPTLTG